MARSFLMLAVYMLVTAYLLGIARGSLSLSSPNSTMAESGKEETNDMKKRGFQAKEVTNSSSAFSPGGDDPIHDKSNMSDTNSGDSTSYNADGAVNLSCADLYYDYVNRSDTKGANSGNSCPQLGVVLYISLILFHICISYLFG